MLDLFKRAMYLSVLDMRECIFLGLANTLPRNHLSDRLCCPLIRMSGVQIGPDSTIWGPLDIRPIGGAKRIQMGHRVFINSRTRFGCPDPGSIKIGNHVAIGPKCIFETYNHSLTINSEGFRPGKAGRIVVEDYVWIGARVTILQGVTIGKGSVVAAGAVVTKDVPPFSLAAGIPAKVIKNIGYDQTGIH